MSKPIAQWNNIQNQKGGWTTVDEFMTTSKAARVTLYLSLSYFLCVFQYYLAPIEIQRLVKDLCFSWS
jgi:hypothetical protein